MPDGTSAALGSPVSGPTSPLLGALERQYLLALFESNYSWDKLLERLLPPTLPWTEWQRLLLTWPLREAKGSLKKKPGARGLRTWMEKRLEGVRRRFRSLYPAEVQDPISAWHQAADDEATVWDQSHPLGPSLGSRFARNETALLKFEDPVRFKRKRRVKSRDPAESTPRLKPEVWFGDASYYEDRQTLLMSLVTKLADRPHVDLSATWNALWACKHLAALEAAEDQWMLPEREILAESKKALPVLRKWLPRILTAYRRVFWFSLFFGAPFPTDGLRPVAGPKGEAENETTAALSRAIEVLKSDPFFSYVDQAEPRRRPRPGWGSQFRRSWRSALDKKLKEAGVPRGCSGQLLICVGLEPYTTKEKRSREIGKKVGSLSSVDRGLLQLTIMVNGEPSTFAYELASEDIEKLLHKDVRAKYRRAAAGELPIVTGIKAVTA